MSEWQMIGVIFLVAFGAFFSGQLWEHRKYMDIWNRGFADGMRVGALNERTKAASPVASAPARRGSLI